MRCCLAFLLCFLLNTAPSSADNPAAVASMQRIVNEALSTAVTSDTSNVRANFKSLILKDVDLDSVIKQLLVRPERLQAIEKAGLMNQLKDFVAWHLAGIYASQITSGHDAKVTVLPHTTTEKDPVLDQTLDVVTTIIETAHYGKVNVDWYLSGGKIIDAKVEGKFRMSLTLKPQYVEMWNKAGGDPARFLELLRTNLNAKQSS